MPHSQCKLCLILLFFGSVRQFLILVVAVKDGATPSCRDACHGHPGNDYYWRSSVSCGGGKEMTYSREERHRFCLSIIVYDSAVDSVAWMGEGSRLHARDRAQSE